MIWRRLCETTTVRRICDENQIGNRGGALGERIGSQLCPRSDTGTYQGTTYRGTTHKGTAYGGTTYSGATATGTGIHRVRQLDADHGQVRVAGLDDAARI